MKKEMTAQREFGEVFTPQPIVDKMFDIVNYDYSKPAYRILDNSAGDGAFLRIALDTKLKKIKGHNLLAFKETIIALASIYGIDLQGSNTDKLRNNLWNIYAKRFFKRFKRKISIDEENLAKLIINQNVLQGDSLKYIDDMGEDLMLNELIFKGTKYWFVETPLNPGKKAKPKISEQWNIKKMEVWNE